jgi:myo-inositol-1(or 4)-monophosphatase
MIDVAREIAEEAGRLLMERFGRLTGGEIERYGRRDVVTLADRESEDLIRRRLGVAFPDLGVLGVEGAGGTTPREQGAKGPVWIVDPLDGTVNFVQGIPVFAVSLGYVEDGVPMLGVVHAPALGQTFLGAPGAGCFEGDRPVAVSIAPEVEDAILATGFAYRRNEVADDNLDSFLGLARRARGIRRMGSAAIDLAYVASGRLDGFWELHLSPWDVAAGAALVRAAGGQVTDQRGGGDFLFGGHIVATNGLLHDGLRAALAPLKGF